LYKIRHKRDINVVGSNGWYANNLLWWINICLRQQKYKCLHL
jgi:hypothetical protein